MDPTGWEGGRGVDGCPQWLPVAESCLVKAGGGVRAAGSRANLKRKKDPREKERPERRRKRSMGGTVHSGEALKP
ncbi:hypothetical protein CDL15_Pgr006557 [Punica granatum]|uniref:Uncharacterized protein n=1 Tax=Punica granatum TaxID=22663 RepID=A0A218Y018_PUNGR|nr:hypothetical protein CDL15_Pgr006557 [Punica granatum]